MSPRRNQKSFAGPRAQTFENFKSLRRTLDKAFLQLNPKGFQTVLETKQRFIAAQAAKEKGLKDFKH